MANTIRVTKAGVQIEYRVASQIIRVTKAGVQIEYGAALTPPSPKYGPAVQVT